MPSPRKPRPSAVERARQAALRSVDLEEARPTFERIARLARRVAGAPIALVSLAEMDQMWLAGVSNWELPSVSRENSFARLVIDAKGVVWIADTWDEPRLDNNPHVHGQGESSVRFYAGAPITLSHGACIGALAVMDAQPRPFDAELAAHLEDFAALVADEWERRKTLKELAASEADARAAHKVLSDIVDISPVSLMITDRDLRVVQVSPRWSQDMGLGDTDVRGMHIYDVFPGSQHRWGDAHAKAMAGGTYHTDCAQLILPDGRRPWVRGEMASWRDAKGEIGGMLIMTHDISDMVEALEKSSRSEQSLKLAMEIGELTMWEMDYSRRTLQGAGVPAGNSDRDYEYRDLAHDIWRAIHPQDRPAAIALWNQHLEDGTPFRTTYRMLRRDGPHHWVHAASEAIKDAHGKVERVVGVLRDIDKEKRAEIALAKARDEAEAANRAKSEFLANMSHEIRTPLNGVMGVASALGRTHLTSGQKEMVGLIESSAETLESLLSDVLDLARIESGRMVLASEPFDLRRSILDVAALFDPSARAKGLDFVVEVAPEAEGVFLGDAARLRQILSNLVANAVKFTEAGQVRILAGALRNPDGIEARICICDTGIGFDAETKARLFGRFEQADGSITRRFGGTGLGLAISRSLAEQMGGVLDAEATPGEGAVFSFSLNLPRAAVQSLADRAREDERAAEPVETALKVLLAEDHPTNRRVVELILSAAGVDLTSVENGALAVDAWQSGDFDLVLMDMQMPVMDGLSAMRLIRSREATQSRPRTPIYALTANAMPEHTHASHQAGADGHLTKPITAAALFEVVRTVAGQVSEVAAARRAVG